MMSVTFTKLNSRFTFVLLLSIFMVSESLIAQGADFRTSYSYLSEAPPFQQGRIPQLDNLFGRVKEGFWQGNVDLEKIKGSPYLSENFAKSSIYYDKKPVGRLLMRYNAYSDEIEIKKSEGSEEVAALIKSKYVSCELNKQRLIFTSFKPENKMQSDGYLISMTNADNKYVLCKRIKTIYKDRGVEPSTSLSKAIEAKFATFTSYYILTDKEAVAKELPKKQKKLLSIFPEQDLSAISEFIKDQNINIKKEDGLVKLFNYINSIDSKS